MIALRKAHPSMARSRYWREDVQWFGTGPQADLSTDSRHLAYYLSGVSQQDDDIYVMINAHWEDTQFQIQKFQMGRWKLAVDTACKSPADICEPGEELPVMSPLHVVRARSIVVLIGKRQAEV